MSNIRYDEEAALYVNDSISTDSKKKTVFLIGDSIRMGYCEKVKELMKDVAEVYYPDDNCRYCQYTYVSLAVWKNIFADPNSVDIVQWNNGHWDIAHWDDVDSLNSIEEYTKMLVRIAAKLKKYFPNAKVIFQTTLPMNPDNDEAINSRTTREIKAYNEAAKKIFEGTDVFIDDAFALFEDKTGDMFVDYCHLTDEGYDLIAKHVNENIRSLF
ncbi:MAG: SGNH/GDSL hydrolase family protein [Clostridia bacterium]|nr:SGNH/GDSL hydrolase family protein [Clostridia bacterium]